MGRAIARDRKPLNINSELTASQNREMQRILEEFADVMQDHPGKTDTIVHSIVTESADPIRQPPYRVPHAYRDQVAKELEKMERSGVAEPSDSDWASPMVLVKKKDGTLRMCVDFCRVNAVSRVDPYIPNAKD